MRRKKTKQIELIEREDLPRRRSAGTSICGLAIIHAPDRGRRRVNA